MKKYSSILAIGILALFVLPAGALTPIPINNDQIKETFKSVTKVTIPSIKVPTIVNVPLPSNFLYARGIAVYNSTSNVFEPNQILSSVEKVIPENVVSSFDKEPEQAIALLDGKYDTYHDFDLPENGNGKLSIAYRYRNSIRSSSIYLGLDRYVALPNTVTVKAEVNGTEKIILSNFKPTSNTIVFPETTARKWTMEFTYSQPLRITELEIQNLSEVKTTSSLRFLAKPDNEYEVYLNPEIVVPIRTGESPYLGGTEGIKEASIADILPNKVFVEADSDRDGIPDVRDNCVSDKNADQKDDDENGRGDACDDYDKDGVINSLDNCVNDPNSSQVDTDNDKKGDACDGEESRFTEKYPAVVWAGIIFAVLVFIGLFVLVAKQLHKSR